MSPRSADPRVVRRAPAIDIYCVMGDHQECEDVRARLAEQGDHIGCGCGCHVEPWPFEHDG